MYKTWIPNAFIKQLKSFSLEELLKVKQKVDELIQKKTFSYYRTTINSQEYLIDTQNPIISIGRVSTPIEVEIKASIGIDVEDSIELNKEPLKTTKKLEIRDNSLENAINLVDEWMTDESDYDKETYPEIEKALNKNRASF